VLVVVTQTERSSCFPARASKILKWRFIFSGILVASWQLQKIYWRFGKAQYLRPQNRAVFFFTVLRNLDSSTSGYLPTFRMKIIPAFLWLSRPRILLVFEGEKHYGTSKRRYLFVIRLSVPSQTNFVFNNIALRRSNFSVYIHVTLHRNRFLFK